MQEPFTRDSMELMFKKAAKNLPKNNLLGADAGVWTGLMVESCDAMESLQVEINFLQGKQGVFLLSKRVCDKDCRRAQSRQETFRCRRSEDVLQRGQVKDAGRSFRSLKTVIFMIVNHLLQDFLALYDNKKSSR